jgi:hypothetical protein
MTVTWAGSIPVDTNMTVTWAGSIPVDTNMMVTWAGSIPVDTNMTVTWAGKQRSCYSHITLLPDNVINKRHTFNKKGIII